MAIIAFEGFSRRLASEWPDYLNTAAML
jgi:hypothetical protein